MAGALEEQELIELLTSRPLEGIDLIEIRETLQGAVPLSRAKLLLLTGGGFSYPRRSMEAEETPRIEIPLFEAVPRSLVFKSRHCGAITVETEGENLIVETFLSGCGGR